MIWRRVRCRITRLRGRWLQAWGQLTGDENALLAGVRYGLIAATEWQAADQRPPGAGPARDLGLFLER